MKLKSSDPLLKQMMEEKQKKVEGITCLKLNWQSYKIFKRED